MNIHSKQSSRSIWGRRKLGFERLEDRRLMALPPAAPDPNVFATAAEVDQLLRRAVAASARDDAIIAIVDRNGTILGVHVEADVPIVDTATLGFAIDGAVAKRARPHFSRTTAVEERRVIRARSSKSANRRSRSARCKPIPIPPRSIPPSKAPALWPRSVWADIFPQAWPIRRRSICLPSNTRIAPYGEPTAKRTMRIRSSWLLIFRFPKLTACSRAQLAVRPSVAALARCSAAYHCSKTACWWVALACSIPARPATRILNRISISTTRNKRNCSD